MELMNRADVDCVINACDAGREGELIFRLVYEHAKCKKPIKRLWISSLEESAIEIGFKNLRDGAEYDNLYRSALCRAQADWAVGMNVSRLFSVLYDAMLRVGRVQTPTLAMIVEREDRISSFVKEPFYTVEVSNGEFTAEREKTDDKQTADDISASCDGKQATVTSIQRKEKSESPPKLYDLTTLQREANRLFGYTAAQTLNCVQNLYEQKVVTYPRTDSRYITEDMAGGITALVYDVAAALPFAVGDMTVDPAKITNNGKVTDHHAIIPTPSMPKSDLAALPTAERNILNMISTRLVAAVSTAHAYAETVVTVECNGEVFTAKGKTMITEGWKTIEQAFIQSTGKKKKDGDKPLPELSEGQGFAAETSVREGFTQPPKHYSEDLLLSAMETAGADDMPEDAERKGLGTPATRASIIENLVKSEFLTRKDKTLLPTVRGVNLIKILPESVKSAQMTAQWETRLKAVEHGVMPADAFMASINEFVTGLVETHSAPQAEHKALFPSNKQTGEIVGCCPRCGSNVSERQKGFFCENKACKFGLFRENRFFTSKKKTITKPIAVALLSEGRIYIKGLVSEKTGKPYNATVALDDTGDGYVGFKLEFEERKKAENER
jgi:DNA topoisomerase-3